LTGSVKKAVKGLKMLHEFVELGPGNWNRSRLFQVMAEFCDRRVLVIGDVGIDRYTLGTAERISPEAPVPIVWVQEERLKLGLAANVADNVRALDGRAEMVGVVGRDRDAEDLKALFDEAKISKRGLVAAKDRRTVIKERVVADRQQVVRVDYETQGPIADSTRKQVLARYAALLKTVDVVILEDYAKGLLTREMTERVFALARNRKIPVIVDPNARTPLNWYRGAELLTPNTREAQALAGFRITDLASLSAAARTILSASGARMLILTRGKEGMAIFQRGKQEAYLIPTFAREVFDVSGAGDTVIAVLGLALASGASIAEAATLANIAAGVEVGKRGTATVTIDEIAVSLNQLEGVI